ncbi:hypothetical protein ACIRU3_36325 [Streptomyces sp. NPDC101151]|uniref:hypothetical protein n=1 Tax=Streptomyces sp. NPDC101151 TaxID=3366115 RepID=UPI0037FDE713
MTWPAPDTFVLVEGVLLRMLPDSPDTPVGTEVVVGYDAIRRRLVARTATGEKPSAPHEDGAARG